MEEGGGDYRPITGKAVKVLTDTESRESTLDGGASETHFNSALQFLSVSLMLPRVAPLPTVERTLSQCCRHWCSASVLFGYLTPPPFPLPQADQERYRMAFVSCGWCVLVSTMDAVGTPH